METVPVTSRPIDTIAAMRMTAATTRSSVFSKNGWLRSYLPLIYTKMPGAYRIDMSVTPTAPLAHARNTL